MELKADTKDDTTRLDSLVTNGIAGTNHTSTEWQTSGATGGVIKMHDTPEDLQQSATIRINLSSLRPQGNHVRMEVVP
jgi:hypothetical protein